ncbi:hypothetical protein ECC02_008112 [Trypanosoma cruzi]|uniref:Trans-sialidase n=1 Tax=Trypanosoma cruzi TaxID=5693 RepID=A0A7J6XX94_TRYCR|nr:hypothetical protein ECC02_008112 [Trypanosoma cruzi]
MYIGGDRAGDSDDVHVTVSNVLLYSRILSNAKLKAVMKKIAVGTPVAKVPASKGAPQNNSASETFLQSANEAVVMNEERQDATSSSPQSQRSPAQPLGNKNGPAASMQTSSADVIGPSTSGGTGEVKEEEPSSGGMVPALSPALSAGSRPLPTRSPATNRTLALKGTRMLTLPWARTAAPIHSAALTRRPRTAPQKSLTPAQTQQLFNATIVCWTALAPHRLIRAQRLRSPRSHRSPAQPRPWAMTFLIWRISPSWCPWLYLLRATCMGVSLSCAIIAAASGAVGHCGLSAEV